MPEIRDAQELKPGLIIFRRGDVQHDRWYCRLKVPNEDRYKTISLKTIDAAVARTLAYDHDAELRFQVKHQIPVFNRTFAQVAKEYSDKQKERADVGQITHHRWRCLDSQIRTQLNPYCGSTQIALIGQDRWDDYPIWRQKTGKGRALRQVDEDGDQGSHMPVSDGTIRAEMAILKAIMAYAARKQYVRESQVFKGKLPLSRVKREEFTPQEYRKLHTFARTWIEHAAGRYHRWYRTIAYNFILIMSNTGMRPPEAKNLRWRDVSVQADKHGRQFVRLAVRGKGKHRNLVAASTVATYFERIREISKATAPDDFVFTTQDGQPAKSLYHSLIEKLLTESELLHSSSGKRRSTYCFRHTYATFRLTEGVEIYFLAKQMGTSVKMIEDHYGHINPVKNPDRVLQGLPGWEPIANAGLGESDSGVNAAPAEKKRAAASGRRSTRADGRRAARSTRPAGGSRAKSGKRRHRTPSATGNSSGP